MSGRRIVQSDSDSWTRDDKTGLYLGQGGKGLGEGTGEARLPRVLIGIVCKEYVHAQFAENLPSIYIGMDEAFECEVMWAIGHITADGRNDCIEKAKEFNFDYVFFADSDMFFPKATIWRMLKACADVPENVPPVISGVYNTRSNHRLNVYHWIEETKMFETRAVKLNSGLHKCDAVATGCLLIDMAVFDDMKFPYFTYEYWPNHFKGGRLTWVSEDIVWSKKLMDKGIPCWIDTSIVCEHLLNNVSVVQVSDDSYEIHQFGTGKAY